MNEFVVTTLGLLALAVGAVSWNRVRSPEQHQPGRTRSQRPAADGGSGAEVFDATSDASCGDGGGDGGGGGGCD